MVRTLCGVSIKIVRELRILCKCLNKAINHLSMANSLHCYGHVMSGTLELRLRVKENGSLKRKENRQIEENTMAKTLILNAISTSSS